MDLLGHNAKGKRTLMDVLQYRAKHQPEKVWAAVTIDGTIESGFKDVTYGELIKAVDASAHQVEQKYGRSTSFETIAYLGAHDLRYALAFFAFQKCGYKAMFIAPMNRLENNMKLLKDMQCTKCWCSAELMPTAMTLKQEILNLNIVEMQPFDGYLRTYEKPYDFNRAYALTKSDPVLVLHSSGSTGAPKPVVIRNGYFAANDTPMEAPPGRLMAGADVFGRLSDDGRVYSPAPLHHLSGFLIMCNYPIYQGCISVVNPPGVIPKPELVKLILEEQNVKMLWTAPASIEAISHLPGGMHTLESLDCICYTGGPLAPVVGNSLTNKVAVLQFYGSTEAGSVATLIPKPEDWQYLEFHPDFCPDFEPIVDGTFELIWPRKPGLEPHLMFPWTQPDETEHRTKDLFKPHETKPTLWSFHGRTDDVLVFANSGKLNPVSFELAIMGEPGVSGALMIGGGRNRPGLLIEPITSLHDQVSFTHEIWPALDKANTLLSDWAKISKEMVAVVEPGTFIRAPKGTIVRKATTAKFKDLGDGLYESSPS